MTRSDIHSKARVEPAVPPYDAEVQAAIDAVMRGNPPLVLFTTLARDPRLFDRFFGGGLLDRGHLTLRQREIVIHRVTARCGAEYEWGVHAAIYAGAAGLDDAELRALLDGAADATCWTAEDRVLVELCDSLHDTCDVGDDLWDRLRATCSDEALIELIMLAGFYRTVSYLVRGLRLPLEPGARRFADVRR